MTTETCWADPLNHTELRNLAAVLAGASRTSRKAARRTSRRGEAEQSISLTLMWAEIANLHTDVTFRAEAAR